MLLVVEQNYLEESESCIREEVKRMNLIPGNN